jgi:hypothetical protein
MLLLLSFTICWREKNLEWTMQCTTGGPVALESRKSARRADRFQVPQICSARRPFFQVSRKSARRADRFPSLLQICLVLIEAFENDCVMLSARELRFKFRNTQSEKYFIFTV